MPSCSIRACRQLPRFADGSGFFREQRAIAQVVRCTIKQATTNPAIRPYSTTGHGGARLTDHLAVSTEPAMPAVRASRQREVSEFFETITDTIKRFDDVEVIVDLFELLSQALDVTVDRAVIDVNLIIISRIHQ